MNDELKATIVLVMVSLIAAMWLVTQKWFWLLLSYSIVATSAIMTMWCLAYLNFIGFVLWLTLLVGTFWIIGLWYERTEAAKQSNKMA